MAGTVAATVLAHKRAPATPLPASARVPRLMTRAAPLAVAALSLTCAALAACDPEPLPPVAPPPPPVETAAPAPPAPPPAPPPKLDALPRADFNRLAVQLDLPLFWIGDKNLSGAVDPDETAVLWGIGPRDAVWIKDGAFTPTFFAAYTAMLDARAKGTFPAGLDEPERKRRAAVLAELAQGTPALVRSDFRAASAEDRALVDHVVAAAEIIERLYARQRGAAGLAASIPPDDAASRMLFYRNQGPWCEAPKTEKDPDCNALPSRPAHVPGLYPASLQKDPKFCEKLDARPDQKTLLAPFGVVVEQGGALAFSPYNVAYKDEMEAVSRELAAAAQAVTSPGEAPLKAYLEADAKAFLDDVWEPADEAWAKMSVDNSKWYLRVAPDEPYADPCSRKAGFQVSFARINQDSLAWQRKLDPRKTEMEAALAKLAGAPYKARSVSFHLPDFVDVVLNAGDQRSALGATIGESLPNWGPVANEGRGRTVAMTNLYTDADSRAAGLEKASSLLCKGTLDTAGLDPALTVMGTVLHEAAHNLGPAHEYKVKGKTTSEIFGGPLASTFEELKAQTSSLYLADWLADKGVIEKKTAALGHLSDIVWAFGHISEGMYAGDGAAKPYSQLAAIQVGSFLDAGAMAWKPVELAANGRDQGCFEIREAKLPAAIAALEKKVLAAMAKGDKAAALKLVEKQVDGGGEWKRLREVIAERLLRLPRASFVYSVER
jgi:hypothetical protein